ncbi:transcription cofactor vestigial-like protein 1 [Grammomys surdaster]|uniref:transcription cofactor vestigial-like protein 1 n=1 Tax=Grammomys surdaster TaxID=491861 RepID=UPI0010A053D1|nr:transcription cofactor vestigial-like protein 1 [Grammomys surdaster]
MEEMKKTGVRMPKSRQKPIKTEWNPRCVLFTYFQGDISSVVDEHFSRALSNLKRPQELSSSSHSENVLLKNDSSMPPNQWRLASWTKPQPKASPANGASSSSMDGYGPKAMDQHSLSMPKLPSAHPQELWQFSSLARPDFLEPAYFCVFPDRHLASEVYPDGTRGSLQHLVQQDRNQNHPLEPAARENCSPAKRAGSTGLLMNLPPNSGHCKEMLRDTCKVTMIDSDLA